MDKINANYYINDLLPNLMEDCHDFLGNYFVFQKTVSRQRGESDTTLAQ